MKLLPMLVIASLAIVPLSSMAQAPNTAQLITEGQTAYVKGDYATAKKNFELVNQLEPRNVTAINYLRLLAQRSTKVVAGEGIDRQLARVILPKVELKEATLGSALDYLQQQITKASEGKTAVSFVVKLPDEQVKTQPVALVLRNVPASEALRYLGEVANITFDYEKYAVVVKAKAGAPAPQTVVAPATPQAPVVPGQ